ncbi:MAG: signal transduction histidine kinase [Kiritimatiellia bacterium]|jgi:signal transduction histidine kinase
MTRVLIVENDHIIALDLRITLESSGFNVVGTVSRGDKVLDAAVRLSPDILLMDVKLNDSVDGIDAARIVRAQLDLPIVFLTGSRDSVTSQRIHDSGVQGYLIKPFDANEVPRILKQALAQHAAQRHIREQHQELSTLVEAIADAVITINASAHVTHLNPAAERLLRLQRIHADGIALDQLVHLRDGRNGPRIDVDPECSQSLQRAWLIPKNSTPIQVDCSVHPLSGPGNSTRGAVIVLQDLSTKQRLQDTLVHADRMVTVRMMAGNIAHGINNPLQYVLVNTSTVADALEQGAATTEEQQRLAALLRDAIKGARAIETMGRDLKLLSTVDNRTRDAIDVRRLVDETLRQLQQQVRWRGTLQNDLGFTLPVRADPKALQQVLINLVQNAVLSLPETYSPEHWVRVHTGSLGQQVFLEVQDNGTGIPTDVQERMFDPFFTTRQVGEGSGLGLSVVKQIIDDLGGAIEVWSEVGQGTKVRVSLPHQPNTTIMQPESLVPKDQVSTTRSRILVVDDEPLVRRALVSMLSRVHDVQHAASVDEALELIRDGEVFDAVLCDLMMSPKTGVEFVEALRNANSSMELCTAFITGGVMSGEMQERVLQTGRTVAYKPIGRDQLLRLVHDLVN